jgi:non-ribosomal peptide synthetase component E (peptide arylation enzyme)
MTYRGTVRQGVVVLEPGAALGEGTVVEVHPVEVPAKAQPPGETIWDKLLKLSGSARGLPSDAAREHDHYLYGTPKRQAFE